MSKQNPFYQIQDAAIVAMLVTLGCKFVRNDRGDVLPCMNVYDAENLAKLGYSGGTWALEDAARDAFQKGKRGRITYTLERDALLEELIGHWNKMSEMIERADHAAAGHGSQSDRIDDIDPAQAARLLCQYSKNRKVIANAWKSVEPLVCVRGSSKRRKEGDKVIITGSFKMISLNASQKTRRRLGI